jgi:hypothetical protein
MERVGWREVDGKSEWREMDEEKWMDGQSGWTKLDGERWMNCLSSLFDFASTIT